MDGRTDRRTDGQTDERTDGRTDGRTEGRQQMDGLLLMYRIVITVFVGGFAWPRHGSRASTARARATSKPSPTSDSSFLSSRRPTDAAVDRRRPPLLPLPPVPPRNAVGESCCEERRAVGAFVALGQTDQSLMSVGRSVDRLSGRESVRSADRLNCLVERRENSVDQHRTRAPAGRAAWSRQTDCCPPTDRPARWPAGRRERTAVVRLAHRDRGFARRRPTTAGDGRLTGGAGPNRRPGRFATVAVEAAVAAAAAEGPRDIDQSTSDTGCRYEHYPSVWTRCSTRTGLGCGMNGVEGRGVVQKLTADRSRVGARQRGRPGGSSRPDGSGGNARRQGEANPMRRPPARPPERPARLMIVNFNLSSKPLCIIRKLC